MILTNKSACGAERFTLSLNEIVDFAQDLYVSWARRDFHRGAITAAAVMVAVMAHHKHDTLDGDRNRSASEQEEGEEAAKGREKGIHALKELNSFPSFLVTGRNFTASFFSPFRHLRYAALHTLNEWRHRSYNNNKIR
jgi:hypothetical protein